MKLNGELIISELYLVLPRSGAWEAFVRVSADSSPVKGGRAELEFRDQIFIGKLHKVDPLQSGTYKCEIRPETGPALAAKTFTNRTLRSVIQETVFAAGLQLHLASQIPSQTGTWHRRSGTLEAALEMLPVEWNIWPDGQVAVSVWPKSTSELFWLNAELDLAGVQGTLYPTGTLFPGAGHRMVSYYAKAERLLRLVALDA